MKGPEHSPEHTKSELTSMMDDRPFESKSFASFFTDWCTINDSLIPCFLSRHEWMDRILETDSLAAIVEARDDGKQNLWLPKDLQLWEIGPILTVIAPDSKKNHELLHLGTLFRNTGIYIAQRLDGVVAGKEIAEAVAYEFYTYGEALTRGEKPTSTSVQEIADHSLNPGETKAVDRWLAGEKLYMLRFGKAGFDYERGRRLALAQYFRIANRASTPYPTAFLNRVDEKIAHAIETPKSELISAIFQRGMERLWKKIRLYGFVSSNVNRILRAVGAPPIHQEKLTDLLDIPTIKEDLATEKKSGTPQTIALKEYEIALSVQKLVSSFPYRHSANNPSEMIANQHINCVGASTLGGALLAELGIRHLVADLPEHSVLLLILANREVIWFDMLHPRFNENLTDKIIHGVKSDGSRITTADIIAFANNPTDDSLLFEVPSLISKEKLPWMSDHHRPFIALHAPQIGQELQVLVNTVARLAVLGQFHEALEAGRRAIAIDPRHFYVKKNMGNVLYELGEIEKARDAYEHAMDIDPNNELTILGLGQAFMELKEYKKALDAFKNFLRIADHKKYRKEIGQVIVLVKTLEITIEKMGRFGELEE